MGFIEDDLLLIPISQHKNLVVPKMIIIPFYLLLSHHQYSTQLKKPIFSE